MIITHIVLKEWQRIYGEMASRMYLERYLGFRNLANNMKQTIHVNEII